MERRGFLRSAVVGAGVVGVGATLTRSAGAVGAGRPVITDVSGGYGPLAGADGNGIELPRGFTSRVIARSGERVAGTGYTWHPAPTGGGVIGDRSGWVYVSDSAVGGAGSVSFDASGVVTGARRVLTGTQENGGGAATPWGTWLCGEKSPLGLVHECDPRRQAATARPALGRFRHASVAVDPDRRCVYLTEDADNGGLYRFVPTTWSDLSTGTLQVLVPTGDTGFDWADVPDAAGISAPVRAQVAGAGVFPRGAGLAYAAGRLWVATRGDNSVRLLDLAGHSFDTAVDTPVGGVGDLTRSTAGELFLAESGGGMALRVLGPDGGVSVFLRVTGQNSSALAGCALAPTGDRLYLSSTHGVGTTGDGGLTYEISGPFRR